MNDVIYITTPVLTSVCRDKASLIERIRHYVTAIQTSRMTDADIHYEKQVLYHDAEQKVKNYSKLNVSQLDKFIHLYSDVTSKSIEGRDGMFSSYIVLTI